MKAYDNSYSKMNMEYKYKDKDKDAERITESLTVCYIFGILMNLQGQPSTAHWAVLGSAQYCLGPPSTVYYRQVQSSKTSKV